MLNFARHLRRLRKERGWTRYRLAKLSGVSKEGVSRLESPGSNPRLSTLFKLARALGITARELVPEGDSAQERRKQLSPEK